MFSAKTIKKIFLFLLLCFSVSSCLIVKEKDEFLVKKRESIAIISPKPEVKMSNKVVRTSTGDMLALLPENWFFIETGESLPSEIFAVAVNPTYTISAIFSQMKANAEHEEIILKEGLLGLSRIFFSKHNSRSVGGLKLLDKYEILEIGLQKFGNYSFIREKDGALGQSAVFISSANRYYEFSLISLNISNETISSRNEFDKIYRSILATLKY